MQPNNQKHAEINQQAVYPEAQHLRDSVTLGEYRHIDRLWYRDKWGSHLEIMPFDGGPSISLTYYREAQPAHARCHVGGETAFGSPKTLLRWAAAIVYAAERLEKLDWLEGPPQA